MKETLLVCSYCSYQIVELADERKAASLCCHCPQYKLDKPIYFNHEHLRTGTALCYFKFHNIPFFLHTKNLFLCKSDKKSSLKIRQYVEGAHQSCCQRKYFFKKSPTYFFSIIRMLYQGVVVIQIFKTTSGYKHVLPEDESSVLSIFVCYK